MEYLTIATPHGATGRHLDRSNRDMMTFALRNASRFRRTPLANRSQQARQQSAMRAALGHGPIASSERAVRAAAGLR